MPLIYPDKSIAEQPIVVVSGLPRSGTSMMMAMLQVGGLALLMDQARAADSDNPNGYFEFAPVKKISENQAWLSAARGKAVKIISFLLPNVPAHFTYKIIFMRRTLPQLLASQQRMLHRRGEKPQQDDDKMAQLYEKHLLNIEEWLATQPHIEVIFVDYADTISNPITTAMRVDTFLNGVMNSDAMVAAVHSSLHRQRG